MYYDYHIHSSFSEDCSVDMEIIVKRAIELGIKEICFTDHIDYDMTLEGIPEEIFDPVEYTKEINRLRGIYSGQISIKKGVEIGLQPHIKQKCMDFVAKNDFDFAICSMHTSDKLDIYHGHFFEGKTPKQAYAKYFEELYNSIENNPYYSVLGHYDLLKRHVKHDGDKIMKENFDIIEATFKRVIEDGKGIEINASGFKYNLGHTLPTRDFLQLYKELGGEIITTGSDSHGTGYIADHFDYVYHLLKETGFRYITTFDKMKPQFVKI